MVPDGNLITVICSPILGLFFTFFDLNAFLSNLIALFSHVTIAAGCAEDILLNCFGTLARFFADLRHVELRRVDVVRVIGFLASELIEWL